MPDVPRLVTFPREQYLRRDETIIRSAAATQLTADPAIKPHLDAVAMAEDLAEIHRQAREGYRAKGGQPHRVEIHDIHCEAATQLKLYHLSQLAHLVI